MSDSSTVQKGSECLYHPLNHNDTDPIDVVHHCHITCGVDNPSSWKSHNILIFFLISGEFKKARERQQSGLHNMEPLNQF